MSTDTSDDSPSNESDVVFEGSFSVIGDFHHILSAKGFRDELDTADVILFEYPDEKLDDMGLVHGFKTSYKYSGLLMAIVFLLRYVRRKSIDRGSLVSVVLSEYDKKLVGVDEVDERELYFQARSDVGVKKFFVLIGVFVLLPRRVVLWLMRALIRAVNDKDADDSLVVGDFEGSLVGDDGRNEGMDERDMAMVENIKRYLREHPDVDDVVLVVGMGHVAPMIRLLDEEDVVDINSVDVLNSDVQSEYLRKNRSYDFLVEK